MANDTSAVSDSCDVGALQQEVDQIKAGNAKGFVLVSLYPGETDNDFEITLAFSRAEDVPMEELLYQSMYAIDAVASEDDTFEHVEGGSSETVH